MDFNDKRKTARELNVDISNRNRKLFGKYLFIPPMIPAFVLSVILSDQASFDYFGSLSPSHQEKLSNMGLNSMLSENASLLLLHYCFLIINLTSFILFFYNRPKIIHHVSRSLKETVKLNALRVIFPLMGGSFLHYYYLAVFKEPTCGFRCHSPSFITIHHNYMMHSYTFMSVQLGSAFLILLLFCFPLSYRK